MTAKGNAGAEKGNAERFLSNAERQARFKANKAYKSLPVDVQHTIDRISTSPEERAQRIAIALDYQAKHPGSRHMGIDYDSQIFFNTAKPGDADYHTSGIKELCSCGAVLPQLEQPRQYSAKCYRCCTGQEVACE